MSTKTSLAAGDNYHFYVDIFLDSKCEEVFLAVNNPSMYSVEYVNKGVHQATVAVAPADMDEIALAWIKERKLQGVLGGPVGKEYGSPDSEYE